MIQSAFAAMVPPAALPWQTVLVVEDDPAVQRTVVEMLGSLGYRVLKADNASAALSIVKSGMPIDLLFTDVVMPGEMRSPELARQAIITAFLYKHQGRWADDDQSLDQLAEGDEGDDDDDDGMDDSAATDDFTQIFDQGERE